MIPTPAWEAAWRSSHQQIACASPLDRHLCLARCLAAVGECDPKVAAAATAAASLYEAELAAYGVDVEALSERVRKLLLWAALSPQRQ